VTPPAPRIQAATRDSEPFSLDGRVALVTGGSSGIGLETARTLASWGARVAITHRPQAAPPAPPTGDDRSMTVALDVRDTPSIAAAVAAVVERFGRIDVLVNSAGTNVQQEALDVDEATWDLIVDTNLKGAFFTSQAVARAMLDQGPAPDGGYSIVNVASQMGLVGYHRRAAYCASKAGLVNLTRVLAVEWARSGIRVNAVAPTFISTPLGDEVLDAVPGLRQEIVGRSPMGEIGVPSDVASGILYLASRASRLVTGSTLSIDGGWTAW
jgi:2-deoxy-D-gluconate 3-dehydrogenase